MCYVNYVRESTAFMRYACDQGLTANERLLWYALFDVMNARAKGSDWPEGLIPIPNKRLLSLVPFGEDSLSTARNKLKQRGLIDYQPGKKNAAPPLYKMVYFAPELSTGNAQNGESYPINPGNAQGNAWGNMRGNAWGNMQCNAWGKPADNIINYKTYGLNRTPNHTHAEDPDADAEHARTREVEQMFRDSIGRDGTPEEIRTLIFAWDANEVDKEVLRQAIGQASAYGARSPAVYARELLSAWRCNGVRTIYDLVALQYDGHVAKEE